MELGHAPDASNIGAVVLLSGGQDSVTCLAIAISEHGKKNVHTISFDYGQKHKIELGQAAKVAKAFGVTHKVIKITALSDIVTSELIKHDGDFTKSHAYKKDLPASFVPNRNALLLTLAHAYAQEINASYIFAGMCQTDYSGYPDCRDDFIWSMQQALNIGYQTSIMIFTPLMFLTKAQTFKAAADVGALEIVLEESHTCYHGNRRNRHEWGYGCGECPACTLRAKGWEEYKRSELVQGE